MKSDKSGGLIRWRMHIPAKPVSMFTVLNTDRGRASFWAESAIEVDGHIEFQFINGAVYKSKVLERRPPYVFSIDYFGGRAKFELTSDGMDGTDLLMTHEDVAADEWKEMHAGWLNVLFPSKAWVVHGIDLRNHDPGRSWDHGYADQ